MGSMLMAALRVWPARLLLRVSEWFYPKAVPRVLQRRMDGSWLLVLANEDVGRQIVVLRRYEQRDSRAFETLIRPTDRCVDVGANVGYFTMLMARSAFRGSVVAFDPIPLNQALLRASVELNGYEHVHAICSAVGDCDGTVAFVEAVDGAYSSLLDTGRSKAAVRRDVPICTLDSHWTSLGRVPIDVLKVDVEGAEGLVLDGACQLLESDSRPRVIMMELCDENLTAFGTSVERLVARVEESGYLAWIASRGGLSRFEPRHYNVHFNVFFLRRDASSSTEHV